MSDLISRQEAIDALDGITVVGGRNSAVRIMRSIEAVRDRLKQLPSAQTEIIRCKDCKHHDDEEIGMVYCPRQVGGWVNDDWFCADGERREK